MITLDPTTLLEAYHTALSTLRQEFGPVRELPDVDFFLFGMGSRRKLIYQDGILRDAFSGTIVKQWDVETEIILPPEYAVFIQTKAEQRVRIIEDEMGIWLEEDGKRQSLSLSPLNLPTFAEFKYAPILRVLHQEILINIIDGLPVPNYFVYSKPWYRDGALMAMALQETGNLDLIKDWILSLREPYDYNNAGENEADNLGQALYLISLVADKSHPVVQAVLDELPKFGKENYILGRSDFAERPVYQTKWAKFGLNALSLPDPYEIPAIHDDYSALFWWGFRDQHIGGDRFNETDYPYLDWAEAHFYGEKGGPIGNRNYPLTWEANASQANYPALETVSPLYVAEKLCAPHTWHAVEMFMYLLSFQ